MKFSTGLNLDAFHMSSLRMGHSSNFSVVRPKLLFVQLREWIENRRVLPIRLSIQSNGNLLGGDNA